MTVNGNGRLGGNGKPARVLVVDVPDPLIFISAETEPANTARARGLGALAYLTKPFDPPALASLVAGALAHAR
jgi:CheY-like chemotaxis protein